MESAMQRDVHNKSSKMAGKKDIKTYLYYIDSSNNTATNGNLCLLFSLLHIAWGSNGH